MIELKLTEQLEGDWIAFQHMRTHVEPEVELYGTKWFDYRQLSPLDATREYVRCYAEIYRQTFASRIDWSKAEHIKTLQPDDFLDFPKAPGKKAQLTGCWRGRQIADMIGMPYSLYIAWAIKYRLNFWKQRTLPRPQQLYNEFDIERIQADWEDRQRARLHVSDLPLYHVDNFIGSRDQNAHHEWLFKQAEIRPNRAAMLAQFVNEDRLPWSKVAARYDDDVLERARSYL